MGYCSRLFDRVYLPSQKQLVHSTTRAHTMPESVANSHLFATGVQVPKVSTCPFALLLSNGPAGERALSCTFDWSTAIRLCGRRLSETNMVS